MADLLLAVVATVAGKAGAGDLRRAEHTVRRALPAVLAWVRQTAGGPLARVVRRYVAESTRGASAADVAWGANAAPLTLCCAHATGRAQAVHSAQALGAALAAVTRPSRRANTMRLPSVLAKY